jgi:putative phosphonate metabolism protein
MRYAIYYLPDEDSALWKFGSSVIGYDSVSGRLVGHPDLGPGIDVAAATTEPRTYGFHATLKAPFRLAKGANEEALLSAAARFAASERAIPVGTLEMRALGNFVALAPGCNEILGAFAARCVRAFEPFRAPMTADERARRLRAPITPRQIELMDAWGYPYVFDEFRFHMTLTSSLPLSSLTSLRDALARAYALLSEPMVATSLCVCVQPPNGRFTLLERFPLGA